ncbi:SRPBCC domain-containing protein [Streptomyces sp. NPDC052610]|uniref:SRPBCC domain-containing protein n=1 Tax=Streptomyces sp. NPDC052610 TaxID=3154952 RepID=UPI003424EDFF
MEHEVFVPVPADRLKAALADPARVARAVPGLQQEAGAEPVAGRLKLRAGGTTITYRGSVRVSARDDGSYAVAGDGTETRGTGTVKLALILRLRTQDDGTALAFEGTAAADGRITELPAEAVASAVSRLLNRFGENLGAEAAGTSEAADTSGTETESEAVSVFDTEIPPSSLDRDADDEPGDEARDETGGDDAASLTRDFAESPAPPAEAAHARRTMIGRSAEEVDHAPPRGRYAPVPAPQTVVPNSTLRWAAPAAALVVASAIVFGRALRRRRL